jgi:large subunit ribosomal protein L23
MNLYEVLRRPLITEKSTTLQASDKYAFEVAKKSTKPMVAAAVSMAFKVTVTAVNIINVPGKMKRFGRRQLLSPSWKKAIVTVKPGDKITFFEGV